MTKSQRLCMECGEPVPASISGPQRKFCCDAHRKAFNNRRMTRGAELFDRYMAMRYQRSTHSGMIAVMNQMCLNWRETDKRERDGRRSWMTPDLDADPVAK